MKPVHKNQLAVLRRKKGMSQKAVGEHLGFSMATINRHERGNRGLSRQLIDVYADFYNVEPFDLYVSLSQQE